MKKQEIIDHLNDLDLKLDIDCWETKIISPLNPSGDRNFITFRDKTFPDSGFLIIFKDQLDTDIKMINRMIRKFFIDHGKYLMKMEYNELMTI